MLSSEKWAGWYLRAGVKWRYSLRQTLKMPLLTKIEKPEQFNAAELAIRYWKILNNGLFPVGPWQLQPEFVRQAQSDHMQNLLDALVAEGILS